MTLSTGDYTITNAEYEGKTPTPSCPGEDCYVIGRTVGLISGQVWHITKLKDGKYQIRTKDDHDYAYVGYDDYDHDDPVIMSGPIGDGTPQEWNITPGANPHQYAIRTLESDYWYLVSNKPDAMVKLTTNEETPSILWVILPYSSEK